ncbi:hypothetical protein [Sphingomonas sp. KR3-1]|uniref:hypothetical protein n=1 Tax=Sphingomonas sp. KR3-1 TaxID=3156611 RepID=UPI0032B5BE8F
MTRLLAELQTTILSQAIRLFEDDIDRITIFALIMRDTYGFDPADQRPPHSISAHSLAMSLSRPYETVRRHVNALVDAGWCTRGPDGVRASPAELESPEVVAFLTLMHDAAVRFVADLAHCGVPMPEVGAARPYHHAAGVQAAIDMMLAVIDSNRRTHGDWLELVVFSTIYCANSRLISADRGLARRYADGRATPPSDLCPPVRTSAVARALGLPEATVRRRVASLCADGRVERLGKKLMVSETWLNRPESVATSTQSFAIVRLLLARLGANGFPLEDPSRAYLASRPAIPAFD